MLSRLVRIALAVAIVSEIEEREYTVTWALHSASACVGMGYLNIGIREGMVVILAAWAGGMRRGKDTLSSTPL